MTFLSNLVIGAALIALPAAAQQTRTQERSASDSQSITGCLQQGADAQHFLIRDARGENHSVMSQSVNLKPHLGHTVTLTMSAPESGQAKTQTRGEEAMNVIDLKMVSTSCAAGSQRP